MTEPIILTSDLSATFQALRGRDPARIRQQRIEEHPDYKRVPQNNYAPITTVHTGNWGSGMMRTASGSSGMIYGQPQFFSPIHTPINWQLPSKRIEQYQWARFFYENEPKVASAIDFYSEFPMSDWDHECKSTEVKLYFDNFKKRLQLTKWCKLISHEIHLLGDCFPMIEVDCPHCHGHGKLGSEICEHEGGTVRRIVILNPDYVDVFTSPLNPEPILALRPDEELMNMVQRKVPGFERLHPDVIKLVSSGQPIRLDNRNIAHLKYGECGYQRFGVGMIRRLFPILSYKTKLMVAQWIVAERLIIPIKIVKVGSDERPAGPADIAAVQSQLASTANDPNLTIVTHHAFDLVWAGANGQILTLSNEFEFINQEILDGLMINNALLNGEGPAFGSAQVGIEAMIHRLKTFRKQISDWMEEFIYLPEAKRQGFIDKNPRSDDEEEQYIVPKIKWHKMHLRDEQQQRTFTMQLYEKGLLSAQTVLETFEYDPDQEIERKRYDAVQMMALGKGFGAEGGPGGGPGAGGGMPPMGGGGDMGGMGGPPGGDMGGMGGPPGGDGGGPPISAPGGGGGGPIVAKSTAITVDVADPGQFGGRVLKKKTREQITNEQQKIYNQKMKSQVDSYGQQRDEKGRIIFTEPERQLIAQMTQYIKDGLIKYKIQPQYRLQAGGQEYPIDFAIERLRLGIEADGEMFHGTPEQQTKDKERDLKLNQVGWTIIRFQSDEIDKRPQQVMATIMQEIGKKEEFMKKQIAQAKAAEQAKAAQTEALVKEAASAMEALIFANSTVQENEDDKYLDMDIGDESDISDEQDKNLGE